VSRDDADIEAVDQQQHLLADADDAEIDAASSGSAKVPRGRALLS
jgi:hypothetical protein